MTKEETPSYAEFIWRTESENALRVKKEIEEWLSNIDNETARRGIETYLKREDNQQVRGAYFELYLHERLIRNGFGIDFHPPTATNKPPDFISLIDETPQFYMEATIHKSSSLGEDLFPGIPGSPLIAVLLNTNDSIERKLKKKGTRYQLEELPLILAIDVLDGYFGMDEAEDQYTRLLKNQKSFPRVSAILVASRVDPLMRFPERTELFRNPGAITPLSAKYSTSESILGEDSQWRSLSTWD